MLVQQAFAAKTQDDDPIAYNNLLVMTYEQLSTSLSNTQDSGLKLKN